MATFSPTIVRCVASVVTGDIASCSALTSLAALYLTLIISFPSFPLTPQLEGSPSERKDAVTLSMTRLMRILTTSSTSSPR